MLKALWLTILGWFRTKAVEAAAERKRKEKADWDAMTPKQRESIAIKKLWVAPCKEWMCQN